MSRPEGRYVLPTLIEKTSRGERAVDPYSKLYAERAIFIGVPLDHTAANDVAAQLIQLEHDNPDRDVTIHINCPGGEYTALTTIIDTMRFVTPDIQTVCLGQVVGVGAVLLAAGTKGKRLALPSARIVLRQPELDVVRAHPDDLRIQADEIARIRDGMESMLVEATGQPAERIAADLERDMIFTAADAVTYGLIDSVAVRADGSTKEAG